MPRAYPFSNPDEIKALWLDAQGDERTKFEASYRKYVKVFDIPASVIDPDVVFGTKEIADAAKAVQAVEVELEAVEQAFGGWQIEPESGREIPVWDSPFDS